MARPERPVPGFLGPTEDTEFLCRRQAEAQTKETVIGLRVAQDYSVNWAPFPDGLLRFSLGYNRTVDTRSNTTSALIATNRLAGHAHLRS